MIGDLYRHESKRPLKRGAYHETVVIGEVAREDRVGIDCKTIKVISNSHPRERFPDLSSAPTAFGFIRNHVSRDKLTKITPVSECPCCNGRTTAPKCDDCTDGYIDAVSP